MIQRMLLSFRKVELNDTEGNHEWQSNLQWKRNLNMILLPVHIHKPIFYPSLSLYVQES